MTSNGQDSAKPLRTGDPRELGDYRILGRIGRGGMGTVYLAQTAGGRRVAVKLIHPDLADDEAFRRRFAREVESARRVARFSTAGVIDARLDGEPLFIVSEYVPGPNLAEAIAADGPMAGGTLDGLAMGVAAALTAIHGAGVIHRDLKPANVLLSTVGPKVIDFGIARAMEDDGAVTRSSQLMGTPSYLAPEIIAGGDIAPPSDIFSWGCLVAFAGTGRAPFDAPSVPAVLHQISSKPPVLDGLDDSLRALVEPALSKDPAERPTAQQILNRLVGQEDPSDSVVDSTVVRSWTPPSTARPGAGGALAAGAAGAAAGGAAGAAMAGPPTPPGGGPAEPTSVQPPGPGAGPTPPGGGQAATAHVAPDPTAALPPQDQPTAAGAPPTMPYTPQGPQGPPPQGYAGPPVPGQQPGAAYPPGFGGPGVPPSGPQQGFGPGVQSPPHGQAAAYGGPGAPPGPGMPGGPGGPGVPPGAAPPGAAPSGGGRSRKKVLAAAAVGAALVAAAGTGIFFAMDPSFPEDGTVVYEEDFDSGETEWTDSYDAEFEEDDEYGHAQQQFALGAYEDDQQRRVPAPYGEQHPVHLSMESSLTWESGADYAQAGMYCFGYDADDDDYEEDYRQYEITLRKDGKELVIRRNDGSDGSGTLFKTGEVSGFEGGDAANRLQVTCDRELPDPAADVEDGTVTIRAWVNGDFVGEGVDTQPVPGRGTGLLLHRGTGGSGGDAVALYDDYRLSETAPSEEKDDDAA